MSEMNVINKKTKSNYITSLSFLIIVIITTISIHIYNNYSLVKIEKIKTNISSRQASIIDLEKDTWLQIYSLLQLNKNVISRYKKMNNITTYINHLNILSKKYDLNFLGFNLSDWEIKTRINIKSDKDLIAYEKTRDFINNYRSDSDALFYLDFINNIEWMDEINFNANFKIK